MKRAFSLLFLFVVLGCGQSAPEKNPRATEARKLQSEVPHGQWHWNECKLDRFRVELPAKTAETFDDFADRTMRNYIQRIAGVKYFALDHEQLKAGNFVNRYGYMIVAFHLTPKSQWIKPEQNEPRVNAYIEDELAKKLNTKDRKPGEAKSVTWGGRVASEFVYAATEKQSQITVRKLVNDETSMIYYAAAIENLTRIPDDVAKFFDSFELIPMNGKTPRP